MKKFGWILVLVMLCAPAWAEKKITVQQLKELLTSLQRSSKSDEDVSIELKKIELSEELTRSTMDGLASYLPGHLSTEQLYVLEAQSSALAPPASDVPDLPAPDAAAQKALLDKAANYVNNDFAKLPTLAATKSSFRFQDNMTAVATMSGRGFGTPIQDSNQILTPDGAVYPVHYIGMTQMSVVTEGGVERILNKKDKTRWGENGQIVLLGQGPVLGAVLREAQSAGKIGWLRWETLNGATAAVFSFAVDKKISRYAVNYCCFPDVGQVGQVGRSGSFGGVSSSGDTGTLQTTADWVNFKATVPYHGEIFVDQKTGIVVRLLTEADFKRSDLVHREDQRIDYGPVTVGGQAMVLPVRIIVNTEVIPNGESEARVFTRRTLFTIEYKDYRAAK